MSSLGRNSRVSISQFLCHTQTVSASATPALVGQTSRLTLMVRPPSSHSWSDTELSLGGAIERWEDKTFRRCFEDILTGNWRQHDPYELEYRLDARSSLYGRPGQATVFRTFQGWLAMRFVAIDHPRHALFISLMIDSLVRQRRQREPSVSSPMLSCRTRTRSSVHSSAQPCPPIPPTSLTPRTGSLVCFFLLSLFAMTAA